MKSKCVHINRSGRRGEHEHSPSQKIAHRKWETGNTTPLFRSSSSWRCWKWEIQHLRQIILRDNGDDGKCVTTFMSFENVPDQCTLTPAQIWTQVHRNWHWTRTMLDACMPFQWIYGKCVVNAVKRHQFHFFAANNSILQSWLVSLLF